MKPEELKKKRIELGLTQSRLAEYLKTPYKTYVQWERGQRRVPGMLEVALESVRSKIEKEIRGEKGGSE